ncbi:sperm associated antigen 8 isoform X1 [Phyllopteryx taeniolatus]|uniref:sperm associated antigen 8 isoform X1 n=1 Tax=Phyllopteryx taeniolatus TaxID=161469 RepID=UPI002AD41EB7|nr:sperm associated antigen 8 isoform X1 [Phyllopteryx taeniolatus]
MADVNQRDDVPEEQTREQILRYGHKGILTMNTGSQMENITTLKAAFAPPKSPGVRLRGIRSELLERRIAQIIKDKIHAERNPPLPQTDFSTTTQRDFRVEGFVPQATKNNRFHDYKSEQAISYWSENYQRIQGVSAVESPNTPFRKSAQFSTPIGEQREDIDPFI